MTVFSLPATAWYAWIAVSASIVYLCRDAKATEHLRDRLRRSRVGWLWKGLEECAPCVSAWAGVLGAVLVIPGLVLPFWWSCAYWLVVLAPLSMAGTMYVVTLLSLMQGWAAITRRGTDGKEGT